MANIIKLPAIISVDEQGNRMTLDKLKSEKRRILRNLSILTIIGVLLFKSGLVLILMNGNNIHTGLGIIGLIILLCGIILPMSVSTFMVEDLKITNQEIKEYKHINI